MSHRWSHRAALHWTAAICPSPSAWQTLQMVAGRGASARRGDTGILQLDTVKVGHFSFIFDHHKWSCKNREILRLPLLLSVQSVGMEQAASFTRITLLLLEVK